MKEKLKSCPFCGGEGEIVHNKYMESPDVGNARIPELDDWYVCCKQCRFARLPQWGTCNYYTKEDAIRGWNDRYENAVTGYNLNNLNSFSTKIGDDK